jgi:hypothetical protein
MDSKWHKITDTIVFSGVAGSKTFHLPFSPVTVMADPNEKISDATTDIARTLRETGEYDYPETFCKVIVDQISDSALVRITHNWVAPDSINLPHPGLRISVSRYWTVEGLFPPGFKARGKFIYKDATGLDNTSITNSNDSLVMLYRSGAGHPWKGTAYKLEGSGSSGTITVETLQPGEYSLAVWDRRFLKTKSQKP